MPLYFAYGSNMDRAAMAARCPASQAIGPARLMRHRLVLMQEGYLSVVRDAEGVVHGLLWQLAQRDVAALDRYEGVAEGLYTKSYTAVIAREGPRRALVYCGNNSGAGRSPPGYLEAVIAAARALGLPQSCLAELETLAGRRAPAGAPLHGEEFERIVRVLVTGHVQGVGYRAWTIREAARLHLRGYVRNRRSGDVEAVFAGAAAEIEAMIESCRRGPRYARVTEVAVEPADATALASEAAGAFVELPTV